VKPSSAIGKVLHLAAAALGRGESINFDKATLGALPPGWVVAMTHTGGAPRWVVLKDDSAPSKRVGERYYGSTRTDEPLTMGVSTG
jgi:hypothetical protein